MAKNAAYPPWPVLSVAKKKPCIPLWPLECLCPRARAHNSWTQAVHWRQQTITSFYKIYHTFIHHSNRLMGRCVMWCTWLVVICSVHWLSRNTTVHLHHPSRVPPVQTPRLSQGQLRFLKGNVFTIVYIFPIFCCKKLKGVSWSQPLWSAMLDRAPDGRRSNSENKTQFKNISSCGKIFMVIRWKYISLAWLRFVLQ